MKTDVFATDGTEIQNGDRIEIYLPHQGRYSDLLLARGTVFFKHGSFKVHKDELSEELCPRLDDFAPKCIINILEEEAAQRTARAEKAEAKNRGMKMLLKNRKEKRENR